MIHRTVVDEGASTYIMFVSFWEAIGSLPLNWFPNTLEAFDGRGSCPYSILTNFPITLEGKTINLEVEVIDANLNYNLLLGRSWTLAMFCVVYTLFYVLCFPHEGKIVIVDQLAFLSSSSSNGNAPYMGNTDIPYESVGVGIFKDSSLMGTFSLPPPNVAFINVISTSKILGLFLIKIKLILLAMSCLSSQQNKPIKLLFWLQWPLLNVMLIIVCI